MPETMAGWFQEDARASVFREGSPRADGECVLLWMQRAKRASANPALDAALGCARELGLPVIAFFCLVPAYPRATLRAYAFMAEGLDDLPDALAKRGVGWRLEVGEPGQVVPQVASDLNAAMMITDVDPLRVGRNWRSQVAANIDIPMVAIDADTVVPLAHFEREEYAPRTIRPKILRLLDRSLDASPGEVAAHPVNYRRGSPASDLVARLDIDRSVGPAPDFRGGEREARRRLDTFVAERLARYDTERNRADIDAGSCLSPYLHFGQISPVTIALAVQAAGAPEPARASFLDELIVQRELAINFAWHNPDYDRYAGIPGWARESLAAHAADPRPHVYTLEEFEAASTHDELWNAAMTQMVHEGWLPNRLRMYWGKQIARWTASPEEAFAIAVALNDRYFLDGRDANSYANIAWCVGGRHDRPFGPERPITGLVRPLGIAAMKRSFSIPAYLDRIRQRWPLREPPAT